MSRRDSDSRRPARHRTSHRSLLTRVPRTILAEDIDAVVVPTNRPVRYLTEAVELARELRCPILVLCSGESKAASVGDVFSKVAGAAVTVSSTPRHPLLELRTHRLLSSSAETYLDTGNKRNVALLLGRLLGWRRVLFMDDDIRGLAAVAVRNAAAANGHGGVRSAGWMYRDFPDNSVACHALRSSGLRQDVFIGAGALLVELDGWLPFFPPVYNEDWLFWHDFAVRGELGLAGAARQIRFDPFDDPQRAHREEFGDVLAEGLYALIHQRRSVLVGCLPAYWKDVIEERRRMLAGTERRLWQLRERGTHTRNGYQITRVLRSVAASHAALDAVTTQDLAEFTSLWRYDLYCWNARLHHLPRFSRLTDALGWLGITDVHRSGEV
jgi:hypothetical protein